MVDLDQPSTQECFPVTNTLSSAPETTRSAREAFTAISGLVVGMFVDQLTPDEAQAAS